MMHRDFAFAGFIGAVYPLIDPQQRSHLLLHQIVIFTQILKAGKIHINHLRDMLAEAIGSDGGNRHDFG